MLDLRIDYESTAFSSTCTLTGSVGEEEYADRHAAMCGAPVVLMLRVPRFVAAKAASLRLYHEAEGEITVYPMEWKEIQGDKDVYLVRLDTAEAMPGIRFFSFAVETKAGVFFSHRTGGCDMRLSRSDAAPQDGFQLLLYQFRYPSPAWLDGGIIYQIFVDRFHRGKETPVPDGMEFASDWDSTDLEYPAYPGAPMRNNRVYGGNLDGIRRKLGYLASLGVSLIYLTPIFRSASNHKYDTANYMEIDPLFGTEEDLKRLIHEAKERGIRIMLDGVFNHTGADSIYFNRYGSYPTIGAYQSPQSPYFPWFRFRSYPDQYECWWNIEILPRIHPDEPSCREYFTGAEGVVSHYTSLGIGGLRLDVADELSDDFIRRIKERMTEHDPVSVLYGEVWEDASSKIAYETRKRYYVGDELDGVMNYPLRSAMLAYMRDGGTELLKEYFAEIQPNMPRRIRDHQMNLLGTHDTVRVMTALAGEAPEGKPNSVLKDLRLAEQAYALGRRRLIAAYLTVATLPGIPMIYYGDEVGMEGYADPFNRLTYPWDRQDTVLLQAFREIGRMRRNEPCLADGDFLLIDLTAQSLIIARKKRT